MNVLKKWCDRTWLYLVYILGVVMASTLIWYWDSWDLSQKLVCFLAILIPAHVFEEDSIPGGFYFMNNSGFGSKEPMVYPQNELTNMITNLGAEIIVILLTFFGGRIEVSAVTLVFVFGIAETFNHTRSGFKVLKTYREKGKKTIYGPGLITSWFLLIPLSAAALKWLTSHPVTALQIIGGIIIMLVIAVGLILLPFAISMRVKSPRFAFDDKGYFEKYEN